MMDALLIPKTRYFYTGLFQKQSKHNYMEEVKFRGYINYRILNTNPAIRTHYIQGLTLVEIDKLVTQFSDTEKYQFAGCMIISVDAVHNFAS